MFLQPPPDAKQTKWGKQGHPFHCASIKHAFGHAENQTQETNVVERKPLQTAWAGVDHSLSPAQGATGWRQVTALLAVLKLQPQRVL